MWKSTDGGVTWSLVTAHADFSPRYQHSAFVLNGKLWVVGGRTAVNGVPGKYVGDAWSTTDGVTWTKEIVNAVATSFLMPTVQEAGKVTMIGGLQAAFTNNTWQRTDGNNWYEITPFAQFGPRYTSGTEFNGQMWIIGGEASIGTPGPSVSNDVWRSSDGINWTRVVTSGAIFAPRDRHAVVAFNNAMWIVGGDDANAARSDVWKSTDGATWTLQGSLGTRPRTHHGLAVLNGRMYAAAGADGPYFGATQYNDVWSTADGANWTQTTAAAAFPPRGLFALFVHNNEMWLAGGLAAGPFNDVWRSSDGAAWRVGMSLPITAPP